MFGLLHLPGLAWVMPVHFKGDTRRALVPAGIVELSPWPDAVSIEGFDGGIELTSGSSEWETSCITE
jgi:hypothetical protein